MRTSTTLASFAVVASSPFLSTLTSANPIYIGGEGSAIGQGVELAEPQYRAPQMLGQAQGPGQGQVQGQSRGQASIRILTYMPDTIEVDPPVLEQVDVDLDPQTHVGEAEFEPLLLVAATISHATHPVQCAFSLQDGTTDDTWVLDSQDKTTFIPGREGLEGVARVKCNNLNAGRSNGWLHSGNDDRVIPHEQEMTVGGENGARVPDMLVPEGPEQLEKAINNDRERLEEAFANSESVLDMDSASSSSNVNSLGQDTKSTFSEASDTSLLADPDTESVNGSPFAPFSPAPVIPTATGPLRDGVPYITYLVPQMISGQARIEIPLDMKRDGMLVGRVSWDDDGTAARVLQGIWYDGPKDATCQLISSPPSAAPKQSRGEGLSEPIVATGIQCWSPQDVQARSSQN